MYFELTDRFIVGADLKQTWAFFSSAQNLPVITPPWLAFKILTPEPVTIESESVLDYTIRWMGIPIRWKTRIIDWSPMRQFIDMQVRGPYTLWHHQHSFVETPDGVECRDRVIYQLPVPIVRAIVHPLIVRRQLIEIFRFRRTAIDSHLGGLRPLQEDVVVRRI